MKTKLPILVRFAIASFSKASVQNTFKITGICPLDKTSSVSDSQMIGDTVQPVPSNTETPSDKHESGTSV